MMNFDMPAARKDDGPKINPDGTVEFEFATDEEKAALKEAKAAGIAKNVETGGSGVMLSAKEKAGNWYGDRKPDDTKSSEWALGIEKSSVVSGEEKPAVPEEDPVETLSRQIEDISKKRADLLQQLIMTDNEEEKNRLRAQEETLSRGQGLYEKKLRAISGVPVPEEGTVPESGEGALAA